MSVNKGINYKEFILHRIIRLFPAYWLSIVLAWVTFFLVGMPILNLPWNYILGNILMTQPLFRTGNLVEAYWTLYVELTFYVLIIFTIIAKLTKRIELIIWIGLLILIVLNGIYGFQTPSKSYERFFIITRSILPLICHFSFFASGIIYFRIYNSGFTVNRILILLICFAVTPLVHGLSGLMNLFFDWKVRTFWVLIFNLLFVLISLKKADILNSRLLFFLGKISYPLYLTHMIVVETIEKLLKYKPNNALAIMIGLPVSFAVAICITYGYEIPVQEYLKSKFTIKKFSTTG